LEQLVKVKTNELLQTNELLKEANATKDKFLSIIAHDLKSPFNSLLGFSEILVDDWENMEEGKKLKIVSIIRKALYNTFQLLVNLLDWSRLQTNTITFKPTLFEIGPLITDVLNQQQAHSLMKSITIDTFGDNGLKVYADKNMLNIVIRNLVSNAIKFTPQNGSVKVETLKTENFVKCFISDTGEGLTAEKIDKIFTNQAGISSKGTSGELGTGLGLILCGEFIKKNNGTISVESEPGKGSCFCITLPASIPA